MRKIIVLIGVILFFSCSSDDNTDETLPAIESTFKVTVRDNSPRTIFTQEYGLDSEGKVVKETFTSYLYPEQSSVSIFKYDDQGRVIKEIKDNKPYCRVTWNGDVATVYNSQIEPIYKYTVSDGKLLSYDYILNGTSIHYSYGYDSNGNIISEAANNEFYVEYLDYDTSLTNPMSIIKSIGILRPDSKPFFKNFFETEKDYPYDGGDYFMPMTYYHVQKTVDSNNRIISRSDDRTYYIWDFEYN